VAASELPDTIEWEVLVVDNNSTDQTREVVEEFNRRYPERFRYLFEPKPGKSHALNAGIHGARGEILAFIDDDVTVEPPWLHNLTSALHDGKWAGAGGRTLPASAFSPPRWLALSGPLSMVGILYAHFDIGDAPCELHCAPYGANMAFRRGMFEKHGSFRTDLGPSPHNEIPRPNEDTEFGRRLMAAGEHLRYEPSAIVYHPVSEARIERQYFLGWWFDYGRALVRENGKSQDTGEILKVIGKALPITLRWIRTFNPQLRFYRKCWVWVAAGEVVEIYRQARGAKASRDRLMRQASPRT
jgi:glycosyltransferase involved in cell wall biosynthesis